jgi:2-hydroxy-3-oxopropionate reductase
MLSTILKLRSICRRHPECNEFVKISGGGVPELSGKSGVGKDLRPAAARPIPCSGRVMEVRNLQKEGLMRTVGYIGLGIMGKSIARNILRAGFPIVVHNRSRRAVHELAAEGAKQAFSPSEVAAQADILFTNLPDSPDVETAVLGPNGIIETAHEGQVYVDNSTVRPALARTIAKRLAEKGVQALDAPVSGGDIGARDATLTIMVGGAESALEKVMPVLKAIGRTITHVGGAGAGQVAKAANQIMVAAQMVAMGELLIFSEKAGVDPEKVVGAIKDGAARCWALDVKPPRLFSGNRKPGFKAAMQAKDLNIVLETAREYGVPLPATAQNAQLFQAMLQMGMAELDNSAVIGVTEVLAGIRLEEKITRTPPAVIESILPEESGGPGR